MSKFLYLISPEKIINHKAFLKTLENIFKSKIIKFFQLRIKDEKKIYIINLGKKISRLTKKYNVRFIINDDPYICRLLNADGCHLGQQDVPVNLAEKILKEKKIIGITCHNSKKLATRANIKRINYIAFGAFYPSKTKKVHYKAKLSLLNWAQKNINKPIVAIGGINQKNFKKILKAGANYIACSASVWKSEFGDPLTAVNMFKKRYTYTKLI